MRAHDIIFAIDTCRRCGMTAEEFVDGRADPSDCPMPEGVVSIRAWQMKKMVEGLLRAVERLHREHRAAPD